MITIIDRMKEQGLTQVDMIFLLRKRGIVVQPPQLSASLRGVLTHPKAKLIVKECEEIVSEYESRPVRRAT